MKSQIIVLSLATCLRQSPGFLHPPDDLAGMAASGVRLLTDPELHRRLADAGRRLVVKRFCADRVVPMYEAFYRGLTRTDSDYHGSLGTHGLNGTGQPWKSAAYQPSCGRPGVTRSAFL